MADYYNILGLEKNCNDKQIQAAFRKLALLYHPDKNPKTEEKFKEIVKAYKVLSDPEKRLLYDNGGEENVMDKFSDFFKHFDFAEILNLFRHETYSYTYDKKAQDKKIDLEVSLGEVYTGTTREVDVPKKIICSKCRARPSSQDCEVCLGSGAITLSDSNMKCEFCLGSGRQPCHSCKGTGTKTINKVYEVAIRKGMLSEQEIPFIGEADEEPETRPGDLIFVVRIKHHPQFTIAGRRNLSTVVTLPSKKVPQMCISTVDGRTINVGIPKGAKKVEVDNEGLPDYFDHNLKGKLIVIIEDEQTGKDFEPFIFV